MGKHALRNDKTCLNCGNTVENRYCSVCGQENIEPRQGFGELIAHFLKDITHYDGKFWLTLKSLFTKPGMISRAFLAGKRNSYLQPVRLYIFVSFITFLIPHLLPHPEEDTIETYTQKQLQEIDSIKFDTSGELAYHSDLGLIYHSKYHSIKQLDSAKSALDTTLNPMDNFSYWNHKKAIELKKYQPNELLDLFLETLSRNFPKTLFFYMPLFALIIGLFHSRKNWVYFDHAIFTIHYFSFLLISFSLYTLLLGGLRWLFFYMEADLFMDAKVILFILLQGWAAIYFFKAHKTLYGEKTLVSSMKSMAILTANFILFIGMFLVLLIITIMMLH